MAHVLPQDPKTNLSKCKLPITVYYIKRHSNIPLYHLAGTINVIIFLILILRIENENKLQAVSLFLITFHVQVVYHRILVCVSLSYSYRILRYST